MCDKEKFIIDFGELQKSEETFSFNLNDEYFQSTESEEIKGGEIETTVKVSPKNGCFEVTFCSKGYVVVDCSRCLDPMRLPVNTQDKLIVKYGEEYADEGDDIIIISEADKLFDTYWHIYEFIALTIPPQHAHSEGECNQDMMNILYETGDSGDDEEEQPQEDPRWEKLKGLKLT